MAWCLLFSWSCCSAVDFFESNIDQDVRNVKVLKRADIFHALNRSMLFDIGHLLPPILGFRGQTSTPGLPPSRSGTFDISPSRSNKRSAPSCGGNSGVEGSTVEPHPAVVLVHPPFGNERTKSSLRPLRCSPVSHTSRSSRNTSWWQVDPGAFRLAYDTENISNYLEAETGGRETGRRR